MVYSLSHFPFFKLGTAPHPTRGENPHSPSSIGGYLHSYPLDNTILIILLLGPLEYVEGVNNYFSVLKLKRKNIEGQVYTQVLV